MGLCNKLNCCRHPEKRESSHGTSSTNGNCTNNSKNQPTIQDNKSPTKNGGRVLMESTTTPENSSPDSPTDNQVVPNGKPLDPVYAKVNKDSKQPTTQLPQHIPLTPVKAGFLVSFVIDSRGGAMTGCRGSGLRIILPPGAVEEPVRVTCRFIRPTSHHMTYPPPIRESDALASGIVEVGPVGAKFKCPVLVEIPHFASLAEGSREIVVLRSEDGESWKEHEMENTLNFLENNSWIGEEKELYQDVVSTAQLNKVSDELKTGRVVRLSTMSFPKYFAVLTRLKTQIQSIDSVGGCVKTTPINGSSAEISVTFPNNALKKKIKIGLQTINVPKDLLKSMDNEGGIIDAYPLIGLYPRRRKFHHPIEISVPVMSESRTKEVKKIWIFCSLSGATEKTLWEDVSDSAHVAIRGKKMVFETKVSALFWLFTTNSEYPSDRMLSIASTIYKTMIIKPYMARMTIYYRKQFPHAWCGALRIYLGVNDRLDSHIEQKDDNWEKIVDGREVEVNDRTSFKFNFDANDDLMLDPECQLDAKLDDKLTFRAFHDNSVTILIKSKVGENIKKSTLLMNRLSNLPNASRKEVFAHSQHPLNFSSTLKSPSLLSNKQEEVIEKNEQIIESQSLPDKKEDENSSLKESPNVKLIQVETTQNGDKIIESSSSDEENKSNKDYEVINVSLSQQTSNNLEVDNNEIIETTTTTVIEKETRVISLEENDNDENVEGVANENESTNEYDVVDSDKEKEETEEVDKTSIQSDDKKSQNDTENQPRVDSSSEDESKPRDIHQEKANKE